MNLEEQARLEQSYIAFRDLCASQKDEIERLRAALQAVRNWYFRDGSIGGCDLMMHEHVVPFTKEPDSE